MSTTTGNTFGAAPRMSGIAPFHVMELMQRAKSLEAEGRDIIHLEVGEPDFATAAPIIAAAQEFLAKGHVHYTAGSGLAELRRAIANWYAERFSVTVSAERIIVTAGASTALQLALAALIAPGDEWLIPDPGYPCNRHFVRLFEGQPIALPVGPEQNYQPSAEQITAAWNTQTRGVMLASPSNPTGTLLAPDVLADIWRRVKAAGGQLIVDEIYQGLVYGKAPGTALALSDDIFVINSFSKYFGMTGWRLGWLVVPEAHRRNVEKLAQNMYICAPTIAQHAALAAFTPEATEIFETRRQEFQRRRDVLIDGLRRLGFGIPVVPEGAFYIYADSSRFSSDSFEFAYRLLNEAGVAATPGIDFGENKPGSYMRFAYTTEVKNIAEAVKRMGAFLKPG